MCLRKIFCSVFPVLLISIGVHAQQVNSPRPSHSFPEIDDSTQLTYQTIPSENNTWGYTILVDGRPVIRQTTIPGASGTAGFVSKEIATTVAMYIIDKMRQGIMPPTVSTEELKKLKVL